jgi:hypothetical protein
MYLWAGMSAVGLVTECKLEVLTSSSNVRQQADQCSPQLSLRHPSHSKIRSFLYLPTHHFQCIGRQSTNRAPAMVLSVSVNLLFNFLSCANPSSNTRYQPVSPFFQLNRAVRVIIFDTKNVLGESIGVLLGWIVCSMVAVTLITLLYRHRELKAFEKAQAVATEKA